jgi:glycosyltransferase involved in cell wall biosynthesis
LNERDNMIYANDTQKSSDEPPILSILIPTYNYSEGVLQIINPILKSKSKDLEILIHDDSTYDHVENVIRPLLTSHPYLHYLRNQPRRGAINNWNSLLDIARGRYVILIHHDDFPLSEKFATELVAELQSHAWPDAILLTCIAHNVAQNCVRLCIHNSIRKLVIRRWPAYLLIRNVVGPPAAMVVRRDLCVPYDNQLKWLVDVDAYYRFLSIENRKIEFSKLIMVSSTGLPNAITTNIENERDSITGIERNYIRKKYFPNTSRKYIKDKSRYIAQYSPLEVIIWIAIKAISSFLNYFSGPKVSLSEVLRRKNVP